MDNQFIYISIDANHPLTTIREFSKSISKRLLELLFN